MIRTQSIFALALCILVTGTLLRGQETAKQRVAAATAKAAAPTYLLAYKFKAGEVVRNKVVHLVTIETKIQGVSETAQTRSVSTKRWAIQEVDASGNVTFVHSVEFVDMWQKNSSRPEIKYNSATDEKPPAEYEHVAASVGQPLATITINRFGRVIKRNSDRTSFNPGINDLAVPLPETPIQIGQSWHTPEEIKVRLEDGTVKTIKARQKFTLDKIETGIATISVATEILTPVDDPKVKSQLIQRMQHGHIKFDLDAGRIRSKQMDLDETVIGFAGRDSVMQYLARLTEEPDTSAPKEAKRPILPAPAATQNK